VVLKKLNPGGIFITQSGPAGFLSCTEVFTVINSTLASVFPKVLPYTQHMPVFCDVWGWNMALTDPSQVGGKSSRSSSRVQSAAGAGVGVLWLPGCSCMVAPSDMLAAPLA
jgi:thermospermine synthase